MSQEIYLKNNNKFWNCRMPDDLVVIIRFGKLNPMPNDRFEEVVEQEITKNFDAEDDALNYMTESIALKMEKGYSDFNKAVIIHPVPQINVLKPVDNDAHQPRLIQRSNLSISQLTDQAVSQKSPLGSPRSSEARSDGRGSTDLGKPGHGAISVLLASTWEESVDPTGYYISEKLDGMRMVWTGKTMYSRNGNLISFPKYFVENWPQAQLDGELWLERDSFQRLVSITKKKVPDEEAWRDVKYMVFDAPGLNAPFRVRYERFKRAIEQSNNEHLVCVPHIICNNLEHLQEELGKVQGNKGEGLMLRDPESRYEGRRSKVLLKVKTFEDDEATVLGHEEGSGRCQGMVGALKVRNSWGCEFSIGSGLTDAIRNKPPKIGSVITYKYWGTSKNGTPRFPIYMRDRPKE